MKLNDIIIEIKKLYNNYFLYLNTIIIKTIRNFFPKLNDNELNMIISLTTFILSLISNKYNISEKYWNNNTNDIKAIVLLLLPFINDKNNGELFNELINLNQILYNDLYAMKISKYIMNINRKEILPKNFKFSNISLGLINTNTEFDLYENDEPLIYKFMHHNLIGLLNTLYICNGKGYVNWKNILPINISEYYNIDLYLETVNTIEILSDNMNITEFKIILTNNLLNYKGLWFGDIYNVLRIKYFENFKSLIWLLLPDDFSEQYLIHKLNDIFNLEYILNLKYFVYVDLPDIEKQKFINLLNNIKINLEILKPFLLFFAKYDKYDLIDDDQLLINYFNYIIKNKYNLIWNILKKIITTFSDSVYAKFIMTDLKFNKNYYFRLFNKKIIIAEDIDINLNLYIIFNIIKYLIYNNVDEFKIIKTNLYLDLNYISLDINFQYLFFSRLYNNNIYLTSWLNLENIIPTDNYNDNLKKIFNYFKSILIPLVFEELIMTGILTKFSEETKYDFKNTHECYYYLNNKKYELDYIDLLKNNKFQWINFYAMNWISQINFFQHYIYHQVIYITGATGQGKTTQVPKLLLYASKAIDYKTYPKIIQTEPRTGPTVDNAIRVAQELGCPIDNKGYRLNNYNIQFKFKDDNHECNNFHKGFIKFITDGSILEEVINNLSMYITNKDKLINKPLYDIIIIDEAHEHNVNMDLLIILLRNSCYMNNKIRLIITSATMDMDEPIYRRYFQCINDNLLYPIKSLLIHPIINTELFLPQPIYMDRRYHISPPGKGTQYTITDNYNDKDCTLDEAHEEGINKVLDICNQTLSGGILFFTVGFAEIFKLLEILNMKMPVNCVALPLYSNLDEKYKKIITEININIKNIQNKRENIYKDWAGEYIEKTEVQKGTYDRFIIIATNVAEASITIPDLKYIIDTGYIKNNKFDYKLNINYFILNKISEVSRIQRRGRVGRIGQGIVYYMYNYRSREVIDQIYQITEKNIDISLLKLLANKNTDKLLDNYFNPNIFNIYKKIIKLNDNYKLKYSIINIFLENYFINNKNLFKIYFNDFIVPYEIFYIYKNGYSLDIINDRKGIFYFIHPNENKFIRNILNEIISLTSENMYSIDNLNKYKLIDNNNLISDLGKYLLDITKDNLNVNDGLTIYHANKNNCSAEIKEINNFLIKINFSLLDIIDKENIDWIKFKLIYKNYTSDLLFIYEIINNIKKYFKEILDTIININIETKLNILIEEIKNNFLNNNFSLYPANLFNKLNQLKNNGLFFNKYKIIIFNNLYIQNYLKNLINKHINHISDWSARNFINNNIVLLFLQYKVVSSFKFINNKIIYTKLLINELSNVENIVKSYYNGYKYNIIFPNKNIDINNNKIIIAKNNKIDELITLINISYTKLFFINASYFSEDIINVNLLSNYYNEWLD